MSLLKFRGLSSHARALVCVGVLLDGPKAAATLACAEHQGEILSEVAEDLALLEEEVRIPILGTVLRTALEVQREGEDL